MNKNKKIAMAVVSTVMAGAMVVPLAACNNGEDKGPKADLGEAWNVFDADGNLNYDAYKRDTPVTLNIAIGYENDLTSTAFASGSTYTLPDGKTYQGGAMKPAWVQMGSDLNITWNNVYNNYKTSANLTNIVNGTGLVPYKDTDIFTTDLSVAISRVNAGTDILNLADYLDYMPNFKNFLESNPVVYLSLLQDGMNTTDGSGQKLYVAPYFDGNDDIERYCIIRQDWASLILDGTSEDVGSTQHVIDYTNGMPNTATKFITTGRSATSVEAFMPGTGAIEVDITLPEKDANGEYTKVGKIYKNYANVLAELGKSSALQTAYLAASNNNPYTGNSGNIVDIMNAAIRANANVDGAALVNLFRAYVDACYTKTNTVGAESYYTDRADLFNGYDAAWDVDDLVAMLRCVMTNQQALLGTDSSDGRTTNRKIYGIAPRSGQNDRTPDMVRLACQLYGARGGDSRYEYTYIDNEGKLQDARNDKAFYQALENMNKLRQEGLVADYTGNASFSNKAGYVVDKEDDRNSSESFMMYDYCQTQTLNGFYGGIGGQTASGGSVPDGYNFAPILTPVSQWDVDGDGETDADEYFRFTESWRSVKTSGIALNGELAYAYNKDKLIAALQFVDYLYSEDGQIVSTYGPMATDANGTGGFWYNTVQTNPVETEYNADGSVKTTKNYFTYKKVKYAGSTYKGRVTPTITSELYRAFQGKKKDTNDNTVPSGNVDGAKLSFTNYARYLIGSTLPLGVKDQSFEYQLTSEMGKAGTAKVGAALSNKTADGYTVVRGMTLEINDNDMWYTCVPTGLPVPAAYVNTLSDSSMNDLRYMSGEAKKADDKNFLSIFNVIILKGLTSGQYNFQDVNYTFSGMDDLVTYVSTTKLAQNRENILSAGWTNAKSYWNYLKPNNN